MTSGLCLKLLLYFMGGKEEKHATILLVVKLVVKLTIFNIHPMYLLSLSAFILLCYSTSVLVCSSVLHVCENHDT